MEQERNGKPHFDWKRKCVAPLLGELNSPGRRVATTRYPSALEPVDEDEYQEAVKIATIVSSWAEQVIQHSPLGDMDK